MFEELTSPDLLKKCLKGSTSNVNEAFNNVLWRIASKSDFSGFATLDLATHMAVVLYNDGFSGLLRIMSEAGVEPGNFAAIRARKQDTERLANAEYKTRTEVKKRRLEKKGQRKQQQHRELLREGPTYGPGMF